MKKLLHIAPQLALPILFFICALAACIYQMDLARASEGGIADKVVQSSVAADFSKGIAEGRIELVEFTANPRCMRGRVRKSAAETASLKCGPTLRGYLFKAANPKGLLLVVHGMQSNAGWFLSGDDIAAQGFEVFAFDRRGSGMSEGIHGHVDDDGDFLLDMTGALEFLRNGRLELPIHLHANCFGTRIAIPYMQDHMERATETILREDAKAKRPDIKVEELEWIRGFKFASVINTSPATNMSEVAEGVLLHDKCMQAYVRDRGDWERPKAKSCFSREYNDAWSDLIRKNGVTEFKSEELACLVKYMEAHPVDIRAIDCNGEMTAKIKDPAQNLTLSEPERLCLDNVAYTTDDEAKKGAGGGNDPNDPCTPEKIAQLRGSTKDPHGVFMAKSPLRDEMFTTDPEYLKVIKADTTSIRELSKGFLFAAYTLANRMETWLKGQPHDGKILPSGFDESVLMVLSRQDVMVYNDEIVHEVFQALPAAPESVGPEALQNDCYACNPRVVGFGAVDSARCKPEQLLACKHPQDILECVDPKGEIVGQEGPGGKLVSWKDPTKPFQRCADVRLIEERKPLFPVQQKHVKRLLEIECEHFMEFCKDRAQTERYRKAMLDWLHMDRWQDEWKEQFE